ncbi:MAG: hypothetical protein MI922_06355 [Bacteroidales bacterium]|nr:hypothetical protein [Bacteroidales bacterium]
MKNIINLLIALTFIATYPVVVACSDDDGPTFSTRPASGIIIDINNIVTSNVDTKLGINLNAGIDSDLNREKGAQSLGEALTELGVKHLRFPGGAKSMYYFWAEAPYTNPSSHSWITEGSSWYANAAKNTINFDEFMTICKQTGAEAHINVAWNPDGGLNEELAAAWVKYANITHNHNIKYWEIGNEMWQKKYGFSVSTLAEVVKSYSAAMKAVDPSIKIGVSWKNEQAIINACGNALDFVTISDYSGNNFNTYSNYANGDNVQLTEINATSSKKIVVSEFAPLLFNGEDGSTGDYNADNSNNTGRALISFDHIGQILENKNCEYACFWNTRWYNEGDLCSDALDDLNNLRPTGLALAAWGKFLKNNMVSASSKIETIVPYATLDDKNGDLNIFILNKKESTQAVSISLLSDDKYNSSTNIWQLKGANNKDKNPTFDKVENINIQINTTQAIELPPTSVTVVQLKLK